MHAENLDSAVKRLTQKPMEISPAYIPLMNIVMSIQRVHITKNNEKRAFRRVMNVNEIADYQDYRCTFNWDPLSDSYSSSFDKSTMLTSISEHSGMAKKDLITELERRKNILRWMIDRKIRSYKDVSAIIAEYSARPKEIYEKILAGQEVKPVAVARSN
jgi:flagellar protein FlaI